MDSELLKQVQNIETEILGMVDDFCNKNNINYTLGYGTLLGAVRHHGPIPWDDDVDICMTRNDYNRFIGLWKSANIDGYYLQEAGKGSNSTLNHTKIKKDGTVLASDRDFAKNEHHGIWIDIFAMDKIPLDAKLRKRMLFWAKVRIIFTRNYPLKRNGKAIEILSRMILMMPASIKKMLKDYAEDYVEQYKNMETDYELINLAAPYLLKEFYPKDIMNELIDIEYDGHKFKAVSAYDCMLTTRYGDYMKLPPEEERVCRHNPTHVQL